MPALAPVVLNDGTNNHTFNPSQSSGGDAQFYASSNGARELASSLKIMTRDQGNGARRAIARLSLPVTRDIDGVTKQVDDIILEINCRAPMVTTTAERTKAREQVESLLASAFFAAVFDNNEGFW